MENIRQTCQMSKSRLGVPFGLCIFPRHHFCKSWREIVIRGGEFFVQITDFPVVDRRNNSLEYSNSLEVHAFYTVGNTKNPPRMRGISSVWCKQARLNKLAYRDACPVNQSSAYICLIPLCEIFVSWSHAYSFICSYHTTTRLKHKIIAVWCK